MIKKILMMLITSKKGRDVLARPGFWLAIGNFLLNFGVAIVWLGRSTIKIGSKLWRRWGR